MKNVVIIIFSVVAKSKLATTNRLVIWFNLSSFSVGLLREKVDWGAGNLQVVFYRSIWKVLF